MCILTTTIARLCTGIEEKDVAGCIWYEGILGDAVDEAHAILEGTQTEMPTLENIRAAVAKCLTF